ncbi:MAG: DUF2303 family protein [Victivallales bacterium]|jgi:uncharacterized protein YfdQ (DUF2303 family)
MADKIEKPGVNVQKSSINVSEHSKDALQLMIEVGRQQSAQAMVQKFYEDSSVPYAIIPGANGLEIVNLSSILKRERPERKRGRLEFFDVQSFIGYVNEHKSEATRIFVQNQEAPYTYTAIIDYHQPGEKGLPDWQTHTAKLILKTSTEYDTWVEKNTKGFSQAEFVDFLKDRRPDVFKPCGADLLEIAMTLEATSGARVTSKSRTNNGFHIEFKEDVSARAGKDGSLDIPDSMSLCIPVFQGMQKETIEADFVFRINSGNIVFGYRLIGIETLVQNAVKAAQETIHKETKLPCYIGRIAEK